MTLAKAIPSILAFGPQTGLPSPDTVEQLRRELIQSSQLSSVLDSVKNLTKFWKTLVNFDPSLSLVPGTEFLTDLQQWVVEGGPLPNHSANTYLTPVTILLQIAQYVGYLNQLNVRNPQQSVLQGLQAGGIQGFCVGFLSAATVATSESEAEIATTAAVMLRLAVCIGAYVDKSQFGSQSVKAGCVAVSWREEEVSEEEIVDLVHTFPEAYVSCVTDAHCITVTARLSDIPILIKKLRAHGSHATTVPLEGYFHSDVHASAVEKIMKLAVNRAELRLPLVEKLQAPLRSSVDGEIISSGSLLHLALENTLLKPAAWFKTMKAAIVQLAEGNKDILFSGFGNYLPPSLVRASGIQVLSLSKLEGSKLNDLTNGASITGTNKSTNGVLPEENSEPLGYPPNSIAIVGMSGRFPGADSLDELWELLLSGNSMAEPAPVERLNLPTTGGYATTKWWGNFLRNSDRFDNKFFKKSSREAVAWDPQQRILLEVVYEALESAGYFRAGNLAEPDDYGCYIGAVMNNYYDNMSCQPATAYATIGTSRCFISGCMSHYFGWTGPSLTIDTACSSSLVAINTACRAIWSGECSRAVAGGTNVITSPFDYQNLKAAGFLSPSGQCKPFDAGADGYCRGEGVGAVVLKPLTAALKEKDHIFGVIVGSAANQNVNLSHITVPNSGSQVKLYQDVMNHAGVSPHSVTYVETHGTGTGVGDPVEYRSVRDAFGGPSRESTLYFGSIKGNIGHTEATAGIAGLIKVLLMMEHGQIPEQASHKQMNPKILTHAQDRMEIPRRLLPWSAPLFLACVNSYGAAGSNAAALIRQGPSPKIEQNNDLSKDPLGTRYPLFISAASESSVVSYCRTLSAWLEKLEPGVQVSDITFNLADRANHSLLRTFSTTVATISELKEKLTTFTAGATTVSSPSPEPMILVFGGQESEWIGLSNHVYQSSKLLRNHLDACNQILISSGFESLYPAIFQLTRVSNLTTLHSALFAVQYSSAKAWIDSGLKVSAVVGHSFGQLTALCISGVLSLADALKLVCGRASIMVQHWGPETGSMLSLKADWKTVSKALESVNGNLEIACYNGPKSHVVVGSANEVDALEVFLVENPPFGNSVRRKRLEVTHGFHSRFTEPLLPYLTALSKELDWKQPDIHLELCTERAEYPDYLLVASHTRSPVHFHQAIQRLERKFPKSTFLEAGRGSSVIQLVKGSMTKSEDHLFLSPQLITSNSLDSLADTTVDLWKAGYAVQYWPYHRVQEAQYQFLRVPSYQFEKTRHWLGFTGGRGEKEVMRESIIDTASPTTYEFLTFLRFKDTKKLEAVFRIAPQSDRFKSMLKGHVMAGQSLAPASLYFEIAARAGLFLQSDTSATTFVPVVQDLVMKSPIGLDESRSIVLTLKRLDDLVPSWSFSVTTTLPSSPSGKSSAPFEHSNGRVFLQRRDDSRAAQTFRRFETLTGARRCEEIMSHPDSEGMEGKHIYRAFNHIVHYAENFRGIKKVACLRMEAAGKVTMVVDPSDPVDQRLCDTPMTDSFMQFAGFLVNYFNNGSLEDVLVCSKIAHIEIGGSFNPDANEWLVYSNMTEGGESDASSDAYVFEASSKKMVMAAFGFRFSKMSQALLARMLKSANKSAASEKPDKLIVRPQVQKDSIKDFTAPIQPVQPPQPSRRSQTAQAQPRKRAELFQVLHNVTDIPLKNLKDESTLDELGIDSLMATEVLNDIRASLGLTIDLATFLFFSDLKAILAYIDSQLGATSLQEEFGLPDQQELSLPAQPAQPAQPPPAKCAQSAKPSKRAELLQVLHNVTDIPLEDLTDESTLEDLNIDSLMATEVLNDIRLTLGLTIDLATFLFFPNIKAIATYIDSLGDDSSEEYDSAEGIVLTPPTPVISTPAPISEVSTSARHQTFSSGGFRSRPSINSAYDSFKEIEFRYDQLAEETKAAHFWTEAYPEQKRLILAYIIEAFAKLGCDLKRLNRGDAVPEVQALARHKQLVLQYYRVLEDGDLIVGTNDTFVRTNVALDPTSAEDIYQAMHGLWPQHANVNQLVRIVGAELAECLIGQKEGLQLIFGNRANKSLLEDMYANWPLLRTPTILLGDFLKNAFNNSTGSGKFRILEIGAGTGGTTRYVVKYLQSHGIPFEYTFTDISSSLVAAARKTFKGVEEMSFEVLDIEKPPSQEYENAFHVILATNCIHATRNLNQSLGNLHKMIRQDGALALVEITQNMFWLDIVVGLFEGWWLFEDNRTHALVNEKHWEREMKAAGFKEVLWTDGKSPESKTVRVIGAFKSAPVAAQKPVAKTAVETVVYKTLGDTNIHADVYYPIDPPKTKLPVALMIHGGSHIIFSRKDIRPAQTRLLIEKGFLPVSLDHRLCPEVKLAEGGMVDVCDALEWARNKLPHIKLQRDGIQIDGDRVVVVGWSSGGQLAMSLAWTAPQRCLRPPEAILAFYCPTNYEDEWWRHDIQPNGAEDRGEEYDVLEAIQDRPITNYGIVGAWEPLSDPRIRTDPRCRIVLHINWKAQTLPVIIGGLPNKKSVGSSTQNWNALPQPTLDEIVPCSPLAQIVRGNYHTPTFLIHGINDDLIPWQQSQGTYNALLNEGVTTGLVLVDGAPHICDLSSNPESDGWKAVLKGYEFLSRHV